ncbi:MAG: hypothetical protein IKW51_06510 [Bacteroidales bacterium]|nr:hypothetical protein [Bacteroidales bacterium]
MKKLIITAILTIGLVFNINAQSDGFFAYSNVDTRETSWGIDMPALPASHGLADDQSSAAPIGSGVLLLSAFAIFRLKAKDE